MAAQTADRDTPFKYKERKVLLDVATGVTIYAGSMVAVNATGFAIPASDTASITVIGRAEEQVINAGADGAVEIEVSKGVFKYATLGTVIDQADVGGLAYVSDDQSLEKIGGVTNNIPAGTVEEIDDDGGIWLAIL